MYCDACKLESDNKMKDNYKMCLNLNMKKFSKYPSNPKHAYFELKLSFISKKHFCTSTIYVLWFSQILPGANGSVFKAKQKPAFAAFISSFW